MEGGYPIYVLIQKLQFQKTNCLLNQIILNLDLLNLKNKLKLIKMKNFIIFILMICSSIIYSQDMKVKWEDKDGREFSIRVMSGEFEYSMIPGDDISYDFMGEKVVKIGSVKIRYDFTGNKVIQIGSVKIQYDFMGNKITKVGGLTINYDFMGEKVTGTRGRVMN